MPGQRALGFLTRTLIDSASGQVLAAVLLPNAINPMSGLLQIMPIERVQETNLTMEQAMSMLMTGARWGRRRFCLRGRWRPWNQRWNWCRMSRCFRTRRQKRRVDSQFAGRRCRMRMGSVVENRRGTMGFGRNRCQFPRRKWAAPGLVEETMLLWLSA